MDRSRRDLPRGHEPKPPLHSTEHIQENVERKEIYLYNIDGKQMSGLTRHPFETTVSRHKRQERLLTGVGGEGVGWGHMRIHPIRTGHVRHVNARRRWR